MVKRISMDIKRKNISVKTGKDLIAKVPLIVRDAFSWEFGVALPQKTEESLAKIALKVYIDGEKRQDQIL